MSAGVREGARVVRLFRRLCLVLIVSFAAGCAAPKPFGLAPEAPPLRWNWMRGEFAFVGVNSVQPTLCWEAFPPERERALEPEFLGAVRDVVYDLRVGQDDGTPAPEIQYARDGITETSHRVEEPLQPWSRYLWTVRARFTVRGEMRVTEWGVTKDTYRRSFSPLSPCSYRFQTPGRGE